VTSIPSQIGGEELQRRLSRVRVFLCDVDGILTDGTILVGEGAELKRFHIRDGLGLRILQKSGIKVGWISNRPSKASAARAAELRIDYFWQKEGSKLEAAAALAAEHGFSLNEVCYAGDDVVDLALMKNVGVSVSVADGIEEARNLAHYVTRVPGGHGAVREIVELILKAQGKWETVVRSFSEAKA
jgi:3-deoxy-D-manno-octulosonate 8-phosphate phosphatase (KDO 8-P phosphatase)